MQNRMPLIIAVVLGVIALLAVRSYVKRVEEQADAKLRGRPVVAAAQDIAKGMPLTQDMFAPKDVPEGFIPPQAIEGSDNLKLIIGRKLRVPVTSGQILLWSDLESESRNGFSTLIPEGYRAFSVEISRGVRGGLVQPNDHIDIIGSFTDVKKSEPPVAGTSAAWRDQPEMINAVLLQDVTVLAVGDTFGGRPTQEQGGGELTLAVKLDEAQLLMFAQQHGELGAVLRRDGEIGAQNKIPRVTFKELEKLMGDLDQARQRRIIQIQKGQTVEEVTIEPATKK